MPSEPGFGFGAVVLVPFPFTNQVGGKQRPAAIVSSDAYNARRPDLVVMAITSQLRSSPAFGETWIDDWQGAGLLKPSAIKPILATFEQRLVIRRLGKLGAADRDALVSALSRILGAPSGG